MLHRRQDDIRLLKLEVAEAARRVLVTGKLRGIIPGLDLDMASLQKQLLETRRTGDELALQLESPDNKTRWAITPMAYALGWHSLSCLALSYCKLPYSNKGSKKIFPRIWAQTVICVLSQKATAVEGLWDCSRNDCQQDVTDIHTRVTVSCLCVGQ